MAQTITERQLRGAGLCQTLHWLASGNVDAARLARSYLDAIAKSNVRLNAFVTIDADAAVAQAHASDERRAQGKPIGRLDGVPIAVKDNIDVAGLP
ncbi:MAG TPA: amidase family protein, partial [Rudaea sp.]|nr:amidase family protein [Rudaea sp.]